MKEDIRKHDEKHIIEAIENSKSETSKAEAALRKRPTNFYYGRRWNAHS